ncbi:Vacuolar morphogenesis protein 6 [Tulasnella sp. 403]|nr:Vacuolar morphogenesis protein 6 [Tulasnella sp. 403]
MLSSFRLTAARAARTARPSTSIRALSSTPRSLSDHDHAPVINVGPGAKPGEVATDENQSTGLERFQIEGQLRGVDVFDMQGILMTRQGTLKDPIIVPSFLLLNGKMPAAQNAAMTPIVVESGPEAVNMCMPPFTSKLLISGFKEKIESITSYENGDLVAAFDECKKAFTPRAIEELGYVKDVNSLVVLSGGAVTLFPSPTFSPPTLLTQAKGALSFGIDTSIQYSSDTADAGNNTSQGMPSVVTRLAVGCRRKIVVYTWKDGEAQEVKELNLPHSPRVITFSTPNVLVLSYTSTEHVLLKVPMMSITELVLPAPPPSTTIGGMGKGALSGWGGYMTLGLGAKAKPFVYRTTEDGEFAVKKDNISMFFDPDGQVNRSGGFEWPGPPDETGKLFVPKCLKYLTMD